jgi:choline dehydrogenase-like flavoprotein
MSQGYDVIVVGAGSASCVVASRLAADATRISSEMASA